MLDKIKVVGRIVESGSGKTLNELVTHPKVMLGILANLGYAQELSEFLGRKTNRAMRGFEQ